MNEQVVCTYVLIQFCGYMLQSFPMIFLAYLPLQPDSLRYEKRRFLILLCAAVAAFYAGGSCYLGILRSQGVSWGEVMNLGNLIFAAGLAGMTLVYFLGLQKETRGQTLLYMLVVQYGILIYIANKITVKFMRPMPIGMFSPYSVRDLVTYTIVTLLSFPWIYRFLRYGNVQELVQGNKKTLNFITSCSVAILGLIIIAMQMEANLSMQVSTISSKIYLSVWMICFIVCDLLAYFIYFVCLILEREKEDMRSRLSSYEQQYKWVCDGIEKEKRSRHNLRLHLRTMNTLAQDGEVKKLQDYIGNYLYETEEMEKKKICGNPCLDGILRYYVIQAENNGIHTKCSIQVKETYPFDMVDMTVLFGNAMENALNACGKCSGSSPVIRVIVRQFKKSILIKIENSIPAGTLRKIVKSYGMESIEMIARKYQGSVEAWSEEEKFILRVVLNMEEEGT